MNLKIALVTFLKTKTAITSLLGAGAACRLWKDSVPMGVSPATPYVLYTAPNYEQGMHLKGAEPFAQQDFTFTISAATSESAHSVFEALRNTLHGRLNFVISDGSVNCDVQSVILISGGDSYLSTSDASELGVFEPDLAFRIRFRETSPTLA